MSKLNWNKKLGELAKKLISLNGYMSCVWRPSQARKNDILCHVEVIYSCIFCRVLNHLLFNYRNPSRTIMILFCTASLCRSVALSNNNSCIENLLSMKHELKTFADLVQNGKNIIFLNFFFDNSTYDLIPHEEMSKQWIWITEAYQYILSYSQDGDVFSFGLLNAEKAFLTVKISIANLTEGCKFNVDQYFLHHFHM